MKAVILSTPGEFQIIDAPAPDAPGPGEALVRTHRIGVCGTDFHAFRGKQPFFSYPRILGHELGVEVLAVGEGVSNVQPGDRCSVEPYINCQRCIACRRDRGNCCANMRVMGVHIDGGMREQFLVPARKLHRANALSYEQIALVETLAIGAHAVSRAEVQRGEQVVVIGAGPIGLSVIQFLQAAQANVIVLDVSDARLDFCRRHLGIQHTVNGSAGNPLDAINALTAGDLATTVFDATGNQASMAGALKFLAPSGKLVYVGLFQGDFSLNDPYFHKLETTLLGSRNALPGDFTSLIRMIEEGAINTAPWITHRTPLAAVPTEFAKWLQPDSGVLKAIIEL